LALRAKAIRLDAGGRHSVVTMVVVTAATPEGRSVQRGGSKWYEQDGDRSGSDGNCGGVAQLDAHDDSMLIVIKRTPAIGSHEAEMPDDVIDGVLHLVPRSRMSATVSQMTSTSVIC